MAAFQDTIGLVRPKAGSDVRYRHEDVFWVHVYKGHQSKTKLGLEWWRGDGRFGAYCDVGVRMSKVLL